MFGAGNAAAGTTMFKGVSVDYGNASTNYVDGDLVLSYTNGNSVLTMSGSVVADLLVVGGGGSGSSGGTNSSKPGYGGTGGVSQRNFVPCRAKDQGLEKKVGLYDLVNGKFYPNAGTGDFTAGTDVKNR